ncbi:MAG: beta-galactosidase [Anaerolineae bacterium]|nr:beta-galactosidase [Anaerolineae bacterium]
MPRVAVTPDAITLDGEPALILAGSLRYFHLPHPVLWPPVLERMRMGGLNAVLVPLPWSYHSPEAGFHDFTGPRDLSCLFDAVERAGLWLIVHLGPWVGAGLDGGGVPAWALTIPDARPFIAQGAPFTPSSPLLRHVSVWWERAATFFAARPNLIALVIDPGPGATTELATEAARSLVDTLRLRGVSVPIAVQGAHQFLGEASPLGLCSIGTGESVADRCASHDGHWIHVLSFSAETKALGSLGADPMKVPSRIARSFSAGARLVVVDPIHAGVSWGPLSTATESTDIGVPAPISEGGTLPDAYYRMRRMAMTIATMGAVLAGAGPAQGLSVDPPEHLVGGRSGPAGTVAFLGGSEESMVFADLTLARDAMHISVGDIPIPRTSLAVEPIDWQLREGRLLSSSMEPVLHTVVAGRELLILQNVVGGEVMLSPGFRVRHRRGPVTIERAPQGILVHFDEARLASVVLDGDQGPLQLLALEPALAERSWPLDEVWRATPAYAADWDAGGEQPARGVVIGADYAAPEADGGFRIGLARKGFGYRWGPWRGGDPHTWLAPLSWPAPGTLEVPTLTWTSRAGAPEVLPEYDVRTWVQVQPERGLAPELYGIASSFTWYRGYFGGRAAEARVVCNGTADLYLNGAHIASLSPARDPGSPGAKVVPLPARHIRSQNVLALLIEARGQPPDQIGLVEPNGLISCELAGGRFDRWLLRGGLTGEVRVQGFWGFADWDLVDDVGTTDVVWHRSTFELDSPAGQEAPFYLFMDQTPGICMLYLNGQHVGRSRYPQGKQQRFWLPDGVLCSRGSNELLVAQWTRGADPGIGVTRLEAGPVWRWRSEGRST